MTSAYYGSERRSSERRNRDEVARLQREANEKLVLTAIRAQEEFDAAVVARLRAEKESEEAKHREEELLATAQLRELLIGIIGHDLNNPLTAIVLASERLLWRRKLTDADARLARRILTSGQRMGKIITQLVQFTRARLGGGFELTLESCNLGDVCDDIADELRLSSSTEIRQTNEGDLRGIWDADRIAQALSNIAGNAVNHATPGTPVVIKARAEAAEVAVEVTNQGVCIPQELLPVIFKAFRSAEPTRDPKGDHHHLGLGLFIASEIVRSHGGTLGVTSAEGTTTFTMHLPRALSSG